MSLLLALAIKDKIDILSIETTDKMCFMYISIKGDINTNVKNFGYPL